MAVQAVGEKSVDEHDKKMEKPQELGMVTWGPKLFLGVIVAVLLFFYWLLIYSGGVTVHHT